MSRRYCEEELELCREEVSELKARLDELQMDYAASDGARVRAEEALRLYRDALRTITASTDAVARDVAEAVLAAVGGNKPEESA